MDSFEKFRESHLLPKSSFYSILNNENISEEDYSHAQDVSSTFKCKYMRDYHNNYLKTDVLLLADVFENFRKVCLENFNLDPLWYYTFPGLAWDACLKITKIKLELLSDYKKLMMFGRGTRGGISNIPTRHSEASYNYLQNYNPENQVNLFNILMQIIYMVGQCQKNYQHMILNGYNDYPLAPERLKIK